MSERTLRAYERWASDYDSDPNPHTLLERPWVLNALGLSRGETILDAACGTGFYTQHCVVAGCSVVGIDFSPAMLAIARGRIPAADFILADLNSPLPLAPCTFDSVVCAQALKHLSRLTEVLMEFFRVLKPGGRCVVSVTHPQMDWSGYALRETPHVILSAETDIHHHSQEDYERAFIEAGFPQPVLQPVQVDESIRHLLTEESFGMVANRSQIAVMTARKPTREGLNPKGH